jgi:hypothetical protein
MENRERIGVMSPDTPFCTKIRYLPASNLLKINKLRKKMQLFNFFKKCRYRIAVPLQPKAEKVGEKINIHF